MKIVEGVGFEINYSNNLACYTYNGIYKHLFIKNEEYNNWYNLVNKTVSKKHNTDLKGKIYLGKLSDLPRHKIKDYFISNNLNKTSKLEQAGTIVLNKKYLIDFEEILNINSQQNVYYKLEKYKIYSFYNSNDKNFIRNELLKGYKNHHPKYMDDENIPFIIKIKESDDIKNIPLDLRNFISNKKYEEYYVKIIYRENTIIELINITFLLKTHPEINIIFDEDLLLLLNDEGLTLDNEYLETLDNMFESKSQDNINLALEMLSNINIKQYSFQIALLLNKHKDIFIHGSGLSLKHNRSFKSILEYFKVKNIKFNDDWRLFIVSLYKEYQNNPEYVKILNEFIKQNLNKHLKDFYSPDKNKHFIEIIDNDFKFNI
jgi:hypothetical protein